MNDRIDELAKQAGLHREWYFDNSEINEFAELIIKECARIDSEANNPDHEDGVTYNQTILEHFGVEE